MREPPRRGCAACCSRPRVSPTSWPSSRAAPRTGSCSTSRTRCRPTARPTPASTPGRSAPDSPAITRNIGVYVRVNAVPTEWFEDDLRDALTPGHRRRHRPEDRVACAGRRRRVRALEQLGLAHPCVSSPASRRCSASNGWPSCSGHPCPSCTSAPRTTSPTSAVCAPRTNTEVLYARSRVALAARIAGVHALDQVVTRFDDDARFLTDAARGPRARVPRQALHPSRAGAARATARSRRRPRRSTGRGACSRRTTTRLPRVCPPSRSRVRWSTSPSPVRPAPCSPPPRTPPDARGASPP